MRRRVAHAALLELSGELSAKGQQRLQQLVTRYPAALLEAEQVREEMALFDKLPKHEIAPAEGQAIAAALKRSIHKKLQQRELDNRRRERAKLVYNALAAVSALAACLVLAFGGYLIHLHVQAERQAAIARAEQSLRDYITADSSTFTDYLYDRMARQIDGAAQKQEHIVSTDVSDTDNMHQLMDDLDRTPFPAMQTRADGAL